MSRRSGLQSYLFLIVLSGSGEVAYRDTAKPVPATGSDMGRRSGTSAAGDGGNGSLATVHAKAGDCFFLDCRNEYTHISSEDDPWELMWIHFYGPQCDAYYDYFLKQQTWHFHTAHLAELTAAIQSVIRFHEEPTDDTDLLTAQQIVNILTLICIEANEKGNTDSVLSDKLKSILHYLDEHYVEDISLDLLAERFFISKYYLSHDSKKNMARQSSNTFLPKKSLLPKSFCGTAILLSRRLPDSAA